MALTVGTTMSGFFGMNLVSGLEQSEFAFPVVVAAATCSGAFFALFALNYMSGSTMRKRAEQRLQEIETLNSALSDMSALDYTVSSRFKYVAFRQVTSSSHNNTCGAVENISW